VQEIKTKEKEIEKETEKEKERYLCGKIFVLLQC
jgi:hypothetical protein